MSYPSHVFHRRHETSLPDTRPASSRWLRRAALLAFVALSFGSTQGHPADQSDLRVRPKPHQLELRFTFNILTLARFVGIDSDGDSKISMAELTAAHPRIAAYLNQHVHIEINRKKATLGSTVRFESLWPNAEQTPPMTEPEYAARNVDVTFNQFIDGKRLEDFWLGFEIFEQTGPMQTIRGIFEQDGRIEEVPFSVQDPEYLYDTGFANDPFEQEADKKAARLATSSTPTLPSPPAAMLATGTAATSNAAPPAVKSSATLASPLEPVAEPQSDQRWWMTRAVVLMILLVVGRKLQLSARSRLVSSRRRPRQR